MKSIPILCAVLVFSAHFTELRADNTIPQKASFSRYEALLKKSPFAVATAAATPVAAADFARDLFIANAAHAETGDLVTLASTTDNNFKKYLKTNQPQDGYSISHIEWSDRVGETKVTISKDGQFATLSFNQALLTQPLPHSTSPMMNFNRGNPPSVQGAGVNRIQPAPIPMLPTPPPRVRGVIPRNPTNPANPMRLSTPEVAKPQSQ